jgi:hypothetical protein
MKPLFTGVAALLFVGASFSADAQEDAEVNLKRDIAKLKLDIAKLQIERLDIHLEQYYLKHEKYPENLKALTEGDKSTLKASDLLDPWKNKGKKPDVWTVTPDKETLGNWPAEKK